MDGRPGRSASQSESESENFGRVHKGPVRLMRGGGGGCLGRGPLCDTCVTCVTLVRHLRDVCDTVAGRGGGGLL